MCPHTSSILFFSNTRNNKVLIFIFTFTFNSKVGVINMINLKQVEYSGTQGSKSGHQQNVIIYDKYDLSMSNSLPRESFEVF